MKTCKQYLKDALIYLCGTHLHHHHKTLTIKPSNKWDICTLKKTSLPFLFMNRT